MTVESLFFEYFDEHFDEYFDEIYFFDKTNNIEDVAENSEYPNRQVMHRRFVKEYGEYKVVHWKYSAYNNSIYIEIESEVEE